jgi:enoyl-CoA hydratase/carnithine racemase
VRPIDFLEAALQSRLKIYKGDSSMSQYETVNYHLRDRIAYLELNRPKALNAVTNQMVDEINAALLEFDLDDNAWVLIFHGAGKCFTAGADLKSFTAFAVDKSDDEKRAGEIAALKAGHKSGSMNLRGTGGEGLLGRTINYKPVIGAVHGYALGAGAHWSAECDLLVVAQDTQLAITETTRGMSGARTWAKIKTFMPSKFSTEMLITGRRVTGKELYEHGFANRLAENGKHLEVAEELAQRVLEAPPLAVRDGVRVSRKQWVNISADYDMQIQLTRLHLTEDYKEAGRAFAEKRKPLFNAR